MKVRVKFRKYGAMKFIGHLDVMRYFQKALRRAEIPVKLSGGYSPHMVMSFAHPLGVGVTSDGEYFDLELTEPVSSKEAVKRLQNTMVDGIDVVSFLKISDDKKQTGMSIVAAADYLVSPKYEEWPPGWEEKVEAFFDKKQITLWKKTKKSECEVDIRPMIYACKPQNNAVFMKLATGSAENLKPALVMEALAKDIWKNPECALFSVHRLEIYANMGTETGKEFIPLECLGEEIK